jgi:hypothetical protein
MKTDKITVSRTIEVPGSENVERKTVVTVRKAETAQEMIALAGSIENALDYFNEGRWAELRTKVSNALAGKSAEQKAVDKMVSALLSINSSLTEEAARNMVLAMPNMEAASKVSSEILPTEIDDTYFDAKKAEKAAAKENNPVSANPRTSRK